MLYQYFLYTEVCMAQITISAAFAGYYIKYKIQNKNKKNKDKNEIRDNDAANYDNNEENISSRDFKKEKRVEEDLEHIG